MPYISNKARHEIDSRVRRPVSPGELNYAITALLRSYLENNGHGYTTFNDCLGALEGAKQEFYRRVVVPYEEDKIAENGDVY